MVSIRKPIDHHDSYMLTTNSFVPVCEVVGYCRGTHICVGFSSYGEAKIEMRRLNELDAA
jgi:hypothetical protein